MSRTSAKKATPERRKRTKARASAPAPSPGRKQAAKRSERETAAERRKPARADQESCRHCSKSLKGEEKALFVEEEVGRLFCSEPCIAQFFGPEIRRLEREYNRRSPAGDLDGEEREALAHLRWLTLQEPDEVWREKTLTGDYRYTMIAEFEPAGKPVWCVCICLFLRGEPSFLYLAFPTRQAAMVDRYRKGEQVEWEGEASRGRADRGDDGEKSAEHLLSDRLADDWTEEETVRAQLNNGRSDEDIPPEDYSLYQACLEETLETPDEVWSIRTGDEYAPKLYHFIRYYPDENPGIWFLIVARETEDDEQIEILDAFPSRDPQLVERYRRGDQEVGHADRAAANRMIH
jgi:hypothetical protein